MLSSKSNAVEWSDDGSAPQQVEAEAVNKWLFNKDTVDKALEYLIDSLQREKGTRLRQGWVDVIRGGWQKTARKKPSLCLAYEWGRASQQGIDAVRTGINKPITP